MVASKTQVIDTPEGIAIFHMRAQLAAAKLHLMGMRHSSGRSIIQYLRETYHVTGRTNQAVVKAFSQLIEERQAALN